MANIAPLLQYLDIPGMRGAAAAQLTPWTQTPPPMQFSGLSQDMATMQNARADIGTQPPRYQPPLPIINQPINPPPLPWFAYAGGQALPPNDRIPAPPQRPGMAPETSVTAPGGLPQGNFNPQPAPAQVEVDEQMGNSRYGIQPRTDQGFGSYQPSAADFGEKQTKQQSPFNSDAGMWGILAAGLGILANNYGNYGQAGPAIGKGGLMGLNTFLGERQVQERNKFAQQELDQRAKRDASLDRYYDAQAAAMERNADTNRMKAEQKKYQYKQLKNGGVAIFEGGKLLKVAERPEDFTSLALSLADSEDEKAYARSDPEGFIEFKGESGAKLERAKAGATNIGMKLELDQGKAFTGPIAAQVDASFTKAQSAIESQKTLEGFKKRLDDPKLIAGAGANARLAIEQVAQLFGGDGADLVATRDVIQGLAELTINSRGMLKGQGQVTEYEQKTLEKARSGDISLTVPELKALVKVFTRMNKAQYDAHGSTLRRLAKIKGGEQAMEFFVPDPFPGGDGPKDPWE
jgi:hypothetical protein